MMTPQTFAALFALAQAAPGPNMMVVSLIGWHVAGVGGANPDHGMHARLRQRC